MKKNVGTHLILTLSLPMNLNTFIRWILILTKIQKRFKLLRIECLSLIKCHLCVLIVLLHKKERRKKPSDKNINEWKIKMEHFLHRNAYVQVPFFIFTHSYVYVNTLGSSVTLIVCNFDNYCWIEICTFVLEF